jgi:hypothetical protein
VPASFDDGLDLFVALTRGRNVEPHMAAVQVKGGSSPTPDSHEGSPGLLARPHAARLRCGPRW